MYLLVFGFRALLAVLAARRSISPGPWLTFDHRVTAVAMALVIAASISSTAAVEAGDRLCPQDEAVAPYLLIETSLGPMEIQLFEDAAPIAVATLAALAGARHSTAEHVAGPEGGYYDGLVFDYTQPRVEIRTSERVPEGVHFELEIDAEALGLHGQRLSRLGEAMDVIQRELLVAHGKTKRGGTRSPQLERWLEAWYESYEADFLVGASRKEINEALGYSYRASLASRPVTKGSVALVPRGPAVASPRLSIALQDLPARTGQWMVVGEVVSGLDLADRISVAPLEQPRNVKPQGYVPLEPVVIQSIRQACR